MLLSGAESVVYVHIKKLAKLYESVLIKVCSVPSRLVTLSRIIPRRSCRVEYVLLLSFTVYFSHQNDTASLKQAFEAAALFASEY